MENKKILGIDEQKLINSLVVFACFGLILMSAGLGGNDFLLYAGLLIVCPVCLIFLYVAWDDWNAKERTKSGMVDAVNCRGCGKHIKGLWNFGGYCAACVEKWTWKMPESKRNFHVRDIAFLFAGIVLGLLVAYVLAYHATLGVLESIQFGDIILDFNETEIVRAMADIANATKGAG